MDARTKDRMQFWSVLERCNTYGQYFDDSVNELICTFAGLPRGSISWVRMSDDGKYIEAYIYDHPGQRINLDRFDRFLKWRRASPQAGHEDWIASVEVPHGFKVPGTHCAVSL